MLDHNISCANQIKEDVRNPEIPRVILNMAPEALGDLFEQVRGEIVLAQATLVDVRGPGASDVQDGLAVSSQVTFRLKLSAKEARK